MKFCEKCGNLLIVQKKNGKKGWVCRKCKEFFPDDKAKESAISEKIEDNDEEITVLELKDEIRLLKQRVRDLERERDILLALHRRDID